jgi:alpha-glucosidase
MRAEGVVEGTDRYLSVHEAALTDSAGMTLSRVTDPATFESVLVPYPDGTTKVVATAPHPSPWRTIQVGERPGELIESRLIATLNEPLADVFDPANQGTDWVEPGTYCGVWWEMHKQVASWNPGPNVGATTENIKSYIDFAARVGIPYVFAEGWNVGWDDHPNMDFDQATQYVDYQAVLDYCAQNGVEYLAHNETFGWVANYQSQLDAGLFAGYEADGVRGMKTGYVSGPIHGVETPDGAVESGHHHHGQLLVNHYRAVTRRAAENRLFVNVHEPIKPTGVRRTYPNAFSREGIRGMEQNATGNPNEPNDTCIYPFTRSLAGPVDYNAAIFAVDWAPDGNRLKSTRARQLAFLVVWLSGVRMVTDLPRHYTDEEGDFYEEFQFVRDVPVDWDETRVLAGGIGTHLAIAGGPATRGTSAPSPTTPTGRWNCPSSFWSRTGRTSLACTVVRPGPIACRTPGRWPWTPSSSTPTTLWLRRWAPAAGKRCRSRWRARANGRASRRTRTPARSPNR